jgi:Zn-dependent protease with chaperone function
VILCLPSRSTPPLLHLFANLYDSNRDGLRFILGHEMGHVRLHHVSLWYQIAVAYTQPIPLLGPALSPAARVLL